MQKKGICLGDKAVVKRNGSVFEGIVTMISLRGMNIRIDQGTTFYKWCDVLEVKSKITKQIKDYEDVLSYYANGDHIDQTYLGGHCFEINSVEPGEKAEEILKQYGGN